MPNLCAEALEFAISTILWSKLRRWIVVQVVLEQDRGPELWNTQTNHFSGARAGLAASGADRDRHKRD